VDEAIQNNCKLLLKKKAADNGCQQKEIIFYY